MTRAGVLSLAGLLLAACGGVTPTVTASTSHSPTSSPSLDVAATARNTAACMAYQAAMKPTDELETDLKNNKPEQSNRRSRGSLNHWGYSRRSSPHGSQEPWTSLTNSQLWTPHAQPLLLHASPRAAGPRVRDEGRPSRGWTHPDEAMGTVACARGWARPGPGWGLGRD